MWHRCKQWRICLHAAQSFLPHLSAFSHILPWTVIYSFHKSIQHLSAKLCAHLHQGLWRFQLSSILPGLHGAIKKHDVIWGECQLCTQGKARYNTSDKMVARDSVWQCCWRTREKPWGPRLPIKERRGHGQGASETIVWCLEESMSTEESISRREVVSLIKPVSGQVGGRLKTLDWAACGLVASGAVWWYGGESVDRSGFKAQQLEELETVRTDHSVQASRCEGE